MSVASCDICGRPVRRLNLERVCRLDMCSKCTSSNLARKLEARGWSTDVRAWEVQAQGVIHFIEVMSTRRGREIPIRASFRPEGITQKAIKLFKREIQVGDPEFDDAVYISTDTPELTAGLLESEGVKGAILELVASGGVLRLADDTLQYSAQGKAAIRASQVVLRCSVLLHLVEAFLDTLGGGDSAHEPSSSP